MYGIMYFNTLVAAAAVPSTVCLVNYTHIDGPLLNDRINIAYTDFIRLFSAARRYNTVYRENCTLCINRW